VRPVINPPEPARVNVAVDLGSRERAVSEQLLDHSEVGAAFEQVGGEGVAQAMGVAAQVGKEITRYTHDPNGNPTTRTETSFPLCTQTPSSTSAPTTQPDA
jgi:hypothetical protein